MSDQYFYTILAREAVDTGPYAPVRGVQATLQSVLQRWGGTGRTKTWLCTMQPTPCVMDWQVTSFTSKPSTRCSRLKWT